MTFGADIASGLVELRAHAESLMMSRCLIRRKGDRLNPIKGYAPHEWDVVGTDVPCYLADGTESDVTVGDAERVQAKQLLHLPATFRDLQDADLVVITSGEWVGSAYLVEEARKGDLMTGRRVPVAETTLPRELRDDWTP